MSLQLLNHRVSSTSLMDDPLNLEAASQGLTTMVTFPGLLSSSHSRPLTVSNFRRVISLLHLTGHARFRRAPLPQPSPPPSQQPNQCLSLNFTHPRAPLTSKRPFDIEFAATTTTTMDSFSVSSFLSSAITGDGSVSNSEQGSSLFITPASSIPCKKRCIDHHDKSGNVSAAAARISGSSSTKCHCSKRRNNRVKKAIRVPAISEKVADIPVDEYSWRKYGQKPVKGSPFPRGYYKCSTMRGCQAKKHVERARDDPSMLIVTYEGEHRHPSSAQHQAPPPETSHRRGERGR